MPLLAFSGVIAALFFGLVAIGEAERRAYAPCALFAFGAAFLFGASAFLATL
jgi:hypothetical protein